MPVQTEPKYLGDIVKREYDTLYTRETVTILSGQNLAIGAVVGQVTASGKYKALATSGTAGDQVAAGITIAATDATAGDTKAALIVRGPVVVAASQLTWPAGITDPQKAVALAELAALGIVARTDI